MIDLKKIQHIAKLARLSVDEKQAAQYAEQLTKIMEHFQKISSLSTEGVEPLITPTQVESFWREDEVKKEITAEEIIKNAPSKQGHLFKVPPVV